MSRFVFFLAVLATASLLGVSTAESQAPERAVIAGTLIEDRDADGMLGLGDGGAQTLVQLMQRSTDGGYKCVSETQSDADGKFRFEDLSIADYELLVRWDPGFVDFPNAAGDLTVEGSREELKDGLETHFIRLKKLPEGRAPYGPPSSGGVAVACEGLDNPVMPQNICAKTGPQTYTGPVMFSGGTGSVAFALPAGTYRVWFLPPPSAPGVVACYVEGNSSITFSIPSGVEVAREVNEPAATAVLDAIAASVRFVSEDQPSPAPTATASGGGSMTVRPPDTGDAGLR